VQVPKLGNHLLKRYRSVVFMQRDELELLAVRATLWRMEIEILREIHRYRFAKRGRRFGSDVELMIVYGAAIAHYGFGTPVRALPISRCRARPCVVTWVDWWHSVCLNAKRIKPLCLPSNSVRLRLSVPYDCFAMELRDYYDGATESHQQRCLCSIHSRADLLKATGHVSRAVFVAALGAFFDKLCRRGLGASMPNFILSLTHRAILAASFMLVVLAGVAIAEPLDDGVLKDAAVAHSKGDYATALRLLPPLANQGNAMAQGLLGLMYAKGQGVQQNYDEAVKWYRLAAEQGNHFGQSFLGDMYAKGHGVAQNYAEAVKWYRLAAEQGDGVAQDSLGEMYRDGQGVPQNYAEAVKWFRLAADQGYAFAQFDLALMYGNGQGVPQNFVQAYMWFDVAASQFPIPSDEYSTAIRNRDVASSKMTPVQIGEAQNLAHEWKPKKELEPVFRGGRREN
jgi:hypothetical protein